MNAVFIQLNYREEHIIRFWRLRYIFSCTTLQKSNYINREKFTVQDYSATTTPGRISAAEVNHKSTTILIKTSKK